MFQNAEDREALEVLEELMQGRRLPASDCEGSGSEDPFEHDALAFQKAVGRRAHVSFSMTFAGFGALSFLLCSYIICAGNVGDKPTGRQFYASADKTAYQWPMIAFSTAFGLNFVTLMFERESAKFQLALLACYINLLAAFTDWLCFQGYTPIRRDVWGRQFQLQRIVMWLHATPAMVYLLSIISDFSRVQVYTAMMADIAMIGLGIAAYVAPNTIFNVAANALSFGMFAFLMFQLWSMFDAAILEARHDSSRQSLEMLRFSTVGLWFLFPGIWVLVQFEVLDTATEEWMWCTADFLGKVMFSSSLLYGNFITIEQRRLIAMHIIEEGNRIQVIQELQDLVEQKERFLSSMSHELRTPLNGIIGLSEALLVGSCGPVNEATQKTINTIKTSGSRLLTLINDVLDAATMRKGMLVMKHEKVHLKRIVEDVIELCQPLAKRGVRLLNEVPDNLPPIAGDGGRIIQIFHNLIGNSCKFTHSGFIAIKAALRNGGDAIEISVSDTGIGIPDDKYDQIFLAFEQVDMSTTRQYGGTGLGLSLVKQLVEAHHGTISVKSKIGVGTTFLFTLLTWDSDVDSVDNGQQGQEGNPVSGRSMDSSDGRSLGLMQSQLALQQLFTLPSPAPGSLRTSFSADGDVGSRMLSCAASLMAPTPPRARAHATSLGLRGDRAYRRHSQHCLTAEPRSGAAELAAHKRRPLQRKSLDIRHAGIDAMTAPSTRRSSLNCSEASGSKRSSAESGRASLSRRTAAGLSGASSGASSSQPATLAAALAVLAELRKVQRWSALSVAGADVVMSNRFRTSPTGKTRVLSVDDDMVNQLVIESLLGPEGFDITQAMDGMEALQILEDAQELPDIILLDVMMPGMSGHEVCRRLRERFPLSCIPIIMLSARSSEEHVVDGFSAGCSDYVVKPFGRQEVLARISAHLRCRDILCQAVTLAHRAAQPAPPHHDLKKGLHDAAPSEPPFAQTSSHLNPAPHHTPYHDPGGRLAASLAAATARLAASALAADAASHPPSSSNPLQHNTHSSLHPSLQPPQQQQLHSRRPPLATAQQAVQSSRRPLRSSLSRSNLGAINEAGSPDHSDQGGCSSGGRGTSGTDWDGGGGSSAQPSPASFGAASYVVPVPRGRPDLDQFLAPVPNASKTMTLPLALLRKGPDALLDMAMTAVPLAYPQLTFVGFQLGNLQQLVVDTPVDELVAIFASLFTYVEGITEHYSSYAVEKFGFVGIITLGLNNEADQVSRALSMSRAMLSHIRNLSSRQLELVIGIHTGPAQAVIVGTDYPVLKFVGCTLLETCALVETCPLHCAQVSRKVYDAVKDKELFAPVGASGHGDTTAPTYLLRCGAWKEGCSIAAVLHGKYKLSSAPSTLHLDAQRFSPIQRSLIAIAKIKPRALVDAVAAAMSNARQSSGGGGSSTCSGAAATPASGGGSAAQLLSAAACEAQRQHDSALLERQLQEVSDEADRLQAMVDALEAQQQAAKDNDTQALTQQASESAASKERHRASQLEKQVTELEEMLEVALAERHAAQVVQGELEGRLRASCAHLARLQSPLTETDSPVRRAPAPAATSNPFNSPSISVRRASVGFDPSSSSAGTSAATAAWGAGGGGYGRINSGRRATTDYFGTSLHNHPPKPSFVPRLLPDLHSGSGDPCQRLVARQMSHNAAASRSQEPWVRRHGSATGGGGGGNDLETLRSGGGGGGPDVAMQQLDRSATAARPAVFGAAHAPHSSPYHHHPRQHHGISDHDRGVWISPLSHSGFGSSVHGGFGSTVHVRSSLDHAAAGGTMQWDTHSGMAAATRDAGAAALGQSKRPVDGRADLDASLMGQRRGDHGGGRTGASTDSDGEGGGAELGLEEWDGHQAVGFSSYQRSDAGLTSSRSAMVDMPSLLHEAGLDHLLERFQQEEVTPELVTLLDDASMRELGATSVGARLRLRRAVSNTRRQ